MQTLYKHNGKVYTMYELIKLAVKEVLTEIKNEEVRSKIEMLKAFGPD